MRIILYCGKDRFDMFSFRIMYIYLLCDQNQIKNKIFKTDKTVDRNVIICRSLGSFKKKVWETLVYIIFLVAVTNYLPLFEACDALFSLELRNRQSLIQVLLKNNTTRNACFTAT